MTTEEKAKAYDEALERAKQKHGKFSEFVTKTIEEIFPQLRESEDERIRKELIEFIKWSVDRHFMREDFHQAKRPSEWIAYLENHKESLHIPETCEETAVSLTGEDEGIVNWLYNMLKSGLENAPKDCPDNPIAEKALAWLEKQKEQKPAEWSEEDELMKTVIIQTLETFGGRGTTGMQIDWLKSLRPSWKPSEEDIKMLEHIIGQYETGNKNSKVMGYLPRVEELSFLKNVLSKWKN